MGKLEYMNSTRKFGKKAVCDLWECYKDNITNPVPTAQENMGQVTDIQHVTMTWKRGHFIENLYITSMHHVERYGQTCSRHEQQSMFLISLTADRPLCYVNSSSISQSGNLCFQHPQSSQFSQDSPTLIS